MIALFAAASLLIADPVCAPPPGAEVLWAQTNRYVIVGEIHGSTETPAAFAQLVCDAASRGPVTVALELPTTMQANLDAFLVAPDEASAVATLESGFFTPSERADGRTSVAMLEMLQSVRRLKAAGRDVTFHAFLPGFRRPQGFDQNYHEIDMASSLAAAAQARPEARVLVLVGNIHASKTRIDRIDLLPAAAHLPRGETVTLNVAQQGGQTWSCLAEGCGAHDSLPRYDAEARGVIMGAVSEGAWDGVLAVGPVTASPPATGEPSQPAAAISSGSSS